MIRVAQAGLVIGLLIMGLGTVGCAGDLYGSCEIRPETGDVLESCLTDDGSQTVSCVARDQGQCQSGACGRYQGSRAFCTRSCADDSDCPAGECREFVFQSGERYCVSFDDIENP